MLNLHYESNREQPWVGDWIGLRAWVAPDTEALYDVDAERRYNYRELDEWASRTAQYLRDVLDIGRGDVVAIASLNRAELIALFLATSKIGAVLAPQTVWAAPDDLKYFLRRIQPKVIFFENDYEDRIREAADPEHVRHYVSFEGGDLLRLRDSRGQPPVIKTALKLNDPCFYSCTSGTTGRPKVCVIPYRQVFWNALESVALGAPATGKSMFFPLFHLGGWASFLIALFTGSPAVLGRDMNPDLILDLVRRGEVGYLGVTSTLLKHMVERDGFDKTDFSRVLTVSTVGQPAEYQLLKALWDKGVPAGQAYGMTEAGPANVFVPRPIPGPQGVAIMRRLGATVGRPALHCDLKIVDPSSGAELGPYEEGAICLRSLHNFSGYLGEPDRTAAFVGKDGWLFTGDIGMRDQEGYLQIIRRMDGAEDAAAALRTKVPGWEHGEVDYDNLPMDWVGGLARRRADLMPLRIALVYPDGREITYGHLGAQIERLAAGLQKRGVGKGDRVGLVSASGEDWLRTLLAAGLVGAVLHPSVPNEANEAELRRCRLALSGSGASPAGATPLGDVPVEGRADKPELAISDPALAVRNSATGETEILTHGDLLIRSYGILLSEDLRASTARRMAAPGAGMAFWDAVFPMAHVGGRLLL
jgi:fatty-acyl-CoA synthase